MSESCSNPRQHSIDDASSLTTGVDGRRRKRRIVLLACGLVAVVIGARPACLEYDIWRADVELRRHHHRRAAEHLRDAETMDPENGRVQFLLARLSRRQGNLNQMKVHLKDAQKSGFSVERLEWEQRFALAQTGRFRELSLSPGEILFRSAEISTQDGLEGCEAVVSGLLLTQRTREAERVLEAWAADYPDDPEPHYFRGLIAAESEQWVPAVADFRQALNLDPGRIEFRRHLAESLMNSFQLDAAIVEYRQCLSEEPGHAVTLVGFAECLMGMGKSDDARSAFEKAVQIGPEDFDANSALGKFELDDGNADGAVSWLEKAVSLRPDVVKSRYQLAVALRQLGRTKEADRHFERVHKQKEAASKLETLFESLRKEPHNAEIRYEFASMLMKFGNPSEGVIYFQSVLEFDPDHVPTHTALADYYGSIGEESQARTHRRLAGD